MKYYLDAKASKVKMDVRIIAILRFANKFAENLGMPSHFGLDRLVTEPRESNEVFFQLDPGLYFSEKKE